jgi:octaprenyl-diphosphate synthase
MSLDEIRALVADDFHAVNEMIEARLASRVPLINELGKYIVVSGGKRLRPMLVLLAAHACRYAGRSHIKLAAVIELIHTATLLHDDVVDASLLRRGHETANAIWGDQASVLVGDFLYSRSFQMMTEVKEDPRVMEIMANTTNTIAEGEVMQLVNCRDADTTEERYLAVIRSKTAKLFEAGAQLGAVIGKREETERIALAAYGMHLGTAFQLIDDVLDYRASPAETGKNLGDDLAEGKPTLPLIRVMQVGTPVQATLVRNAITNGGRERIDEIREAIESTRGIDYTILMAKGEARHAVEALGAVPTSAYRDALHALAEFAVNRTY